MEQNRGRDTKILKREGKLGQRVGVFSNLPNYSIIEYAKIPVFHFFEKVNKGQLKMVYVNH